MLLTHANIKQMASRSSQASKDCRCQRGLSEGWETFSKALEVADLLRPVGRVGHEESEEATLDEYHPNGTHFWSVDAPIHLDFYPYNISSIWQCKCCGRVYMRFTDAGAYHAEQRIRVLVTSLLAG